MVKDLSGLRSEYNLSELIEENLPKDPLLLFERWFSDLLEQNVPEPNAMTLATSTKDGKPSARVVLMKSYGSDGFTFYTNYKSRKGIELDQNPHAFLLFYWPELQRQIRIEGEVSQLSSDVSEQYFDSRPEGSKISAIISDQSKVIKSREEIEKKVKEFTGEIKRPVHWGGYSLLPKRFEFWQGRANRLHDRICYEHIEKSEWDRFRLAP